MSGIKDKKIVIYSPEYDNTGGVQSEKWKPIHPGTLWAYTRQLSASEFFAAAATQYQESAFFTVNWRDDIDTYMQIRYKGVWYMITRIDTFEGYKDNLKIYVKTSIGGHIPSEEDVLPFEE